MGIEQSSYQASHNASQKVTGAIPKTKLRQDSTQITEESGRSSPHPSLCSSDTDVPYVSYTVNKPIGGRVLFIFYLCFAFVPFFGI